MNSNPTSRVRRVSAAVVGAVLTVGIAAGCAVAKADEAPRRPVTTGAPPALMSYYSQNLQWGSCSPYAVTEAEKAPFSNKRFDCATMQVPLDYADPTGRKAEIGVMRKKATDPAGRIGSLITDPGGPGGSGMEFLPTFATMVGKTDVARRFDLIGFDPRGVGASTPKLVCRTGPEMDARRATDPAAFSPVDDAKSFAEKCAERTGTDVLANIGTRDVARDLDVLRAVLGDEKLTYLGYSYGTAIGTAYAEAFPGNVRALVLDSAVDPNQSAAEAVTDQGKGFESAIEEFAKDCATHADCPLGTDPAAVEARFGELFDPLATNPATTKDGRPLTQTDASIAIMATMYNAESWPTLRAALADLRAGDGTTLMAIADGYVGRAADGTYSNFQDVLGAVKCADNPHPAATEENAADPCSYWAAPNSSAPHAVHVEGLPTVVVIGSTGDPATPYQAAVNLAKALGARLLTLNANQHGGSYNGSPSLDEATTRYLVDLALPADGATFDLGK